MMGTTISLNQVVSVLLSGVRSFRYHIKILHTLLLHCCGLARTYENLSYKVSIF